MTSAALVVGIAATGALAASSVIPQAEYRAKDAKLTISADGRSFQVFALPVKQECKDPTPANLGDYPSGLGPFSLDADGSFEFSSPGGLGLEGKFTAKKVTGTVTASAFKDPTKDFDCAKYTGRFSARFVKGSGQKPGKIIASDDFSDVDSGFKEFNTTNAFAQYLIDDRYRVGLQGQTGIASPRAEPTGLTSVDIESQTLTYGGDPTDEVGLVCQAVDFDTFTVGTISQNGAAQLFRYEDGVIVERSSEKQAPAGVLNTGLGAKNTLKLVCRPDGDGGTSLELFVNGESVAEAISAVANAGQTGVFVSGSGNGTDYNFSNFIVRVPKS
ncbi:MAG: hypothetical protein EXQ79_09750 [Acidimicrobiia bacterium]|nr:hypothetical protein [Acidimicrobiia bacterium]